MVIFPKVRYQNSNKENYTVSRRIETVPKTRPVICFFSNLSRKLNIPIIETMVIIPIHNTGMKTALGKYLIPCNISGRQIESAAETENIDSIFFIVSFTVRFSI